MNAKMRPNGYNDLQFYCSLHLHEIVETVIFSLQFLSLFVCLSVCLSLSLSVCVFVYVCVSLYECMSANKILIKPCNDLDAVLIKMTAHLTGSDPIEISDLE